jgi:hypothetical protein
MSTRPDLDRSIAEWLAAEASDRAPERLLEASRARIRITRQRRAWLPAWRIPRMNNTVRLVAAVAAVVVVALIGYQLLVAPNVGGPGPGPVPTEEPTLAPTPTPIPTAAADFPPAGELSVGRHSMTLSGVRLSFELSTSGWISNGDFGIDKGVWPDSSAGFIFWTLSAPDNVYADPCARTPLSPPAGPSPADLAAAVSTVPGTELVSEPSEVTVGGYPAQHVVITVPEDIGCAPNAFNLWYDGAPPEELNRWATELNSTIYVWIIDVDGTIIWIDGETYATSSPEAAEELQQIVNSIQFE